MTNSLTNYILIALFLIACKPGKDLPNKRAVFVEGGSFIMGTSNEVIDSLFAHHSFPRGFIQSEYPPHRVTLSSYYMDQYEVTNEEFKQFLDKNPKWRKEIIPDSLHNGNYLEHWVNNDFPVGQELIPIYNISWYVAQAYCQWQGKRLPTEAEWEYAARNRGQSIIYPWGNTSPDSSKVNYKGLIGMAVKVGSYPPNDMSIYDLAGNVWEYTLDEWSPDYYANSPGQDPVNGHKQYDANTLLHVKTRRVIRGGSWGGADVNLRTRFRDSHPPDGAGNYVGCRCVSEIPNIRKD